MYDYKFLKKKQEKRYFMLNNQKIKKMHKLALYESGEGKRHLAISNYYRSDYIGLALIKNFFLTTIAYGILPVSYTHLEFLEAKILEENREAGPPSSGYENTEDEEIPGDAPSQETVNQIRAPVTDIP